MPPDAEVLEQPECRRDRGRSRDVAEHRADVHDDGHTVAELDEACHALVPAARALSLSESAGMVLLSADRLDWVWIVPGHRRSYLECSPDAEHDSTRQVATSAWIRSDELLDHVTRAGADYDAVRRLVDAPGRPSVTSQSRDRSLAGVAP